MERSFSIILLFAGLSLLGCLTANRIPFVFTKEVHASILNITFQWPNAAPEVIERNVTAPIEGLLGTVQGVTSIKSSSSYSAGKIYVEYDQQIDKDKIRFEVASLIRHIYNKLPIGVTYPNIMSGLGYESNNSNPLITLQLNGNTVPGDIRKYAENIIRPKLAQIEGLRTVEVHGGEPSEWVLTYRPESIEALNISEDTLIHSLSENVNLTGLGWVRDDGGQKISVSLSKKTNPLRLGSQIVAIRGGRIIRLSDLVTISEIEKAPSSYFRVNGQNGIQIVLTAQPNVNQLDLVNRINVVLISIKKELPGQFKLRLDYDGTDFIKTSLQITILEFLTTFILILVLSIILFFDIKATLIILIALSMNYLIVALALYILKAEVTFISINSAVVGMGIAGGNIMVSYYSYQKQVKTRIISTMLFSILIMMATFSVVYLISTSIRQDLTSFVQIIILIQLVSFCVCKWLVPSIMAKMVRANRKKSIITEYHYSSILTSYYLIIKYMSQYRRLMWFSVVLLFGLPIFLLPYRLDQDSNFARIYNLIIGNEQFSDNIRPYLERGTGGCLRLFIKYVYENAHEKLNEETALHINASMTNSNTVEQMDYALRQVEIELLKYKQIDRFVTQIRNGQRGSITVFFKEGFDSGDFPYIIKSKVIALSAKTSGIDWDIYGVGQAFSANLSEDSTPMYNVLIKGFDHKYLENIALKLQKKLKLHPRIQNVDINKVPGTFGQKDLHAYKVQTDPFYWALYNTSQNRVYQYLQKFNVRQTADIFEVRGNTYMGINIQPTSESIFDVSNINMYPIRVAPYYWLKLDNQFSISKGKIIPAIRKENQQYLRQVSFEYLGNNELGERYLEETLRNFELPIGYSAERISQGDRIKMGNQHYELLGLALIFTFIIAVVAFESVYHSFTLCLSILLLFVGMFLAFYISKSGFDQGGYVSFLFVIGVISYPTIIVINEHKILKRSSLKASLWCYSEVIANTIRPILCFLLSALTGLIPFLLFEESQQLWSVFAIGIIGSITIYPLVLLYFLPNFLSK